MATSSKMSVCSARSGKSSSSSASAAHARARAEAAKVRASYASQEAKLKMEKATREAQSQLETVRLDTELEVLTLQREADAAEVEAQVLEDAEFAEHAVERGGSVAEEAKIERTSEYVNSQNNLHHYSPPPLLLPLSVTPPFQSGSNSSFVTLSLAVKDTSHAQSIKHKPQKADGMHLPATNLSNLSEGVIKSEVGRTSPIMNVPVKPYVPQYIPPSSTPHQVESLAQYLAKRDLVSSGLYLFDDKPENYRSWYSSFTSAAREVHLTATQELDLMTKWLGKESGEMVKRIRSVHVSNPGLALHKAWERLHECCAAPEIIERSLFQRLDSFPRISVKDHIKLRELADLLMEIQGAKEDGYLTGLSYLDTSRGIAPLVDKLPYGLQDKWVTSGSCYKEQNYGRFPPFEYFCNFVCFEARKRNDPSFMHQSSTTTAAKTDRTIVKSFQTNKAITVHKTDEVQQSGNTSTKSTEKTLGKTVFSRTEDDNKPAPSVKDIAFLKIMDISVYRSDDNSWVAPLPFREPRKPLPNNKEQVVNRLTSLQRTLKRKPGMQQQYVEFMEGSLPMDMLR
ncbi:uncharacterized protein LOC125145101 [Tachysurus ichikawai]